MNTLQCIQQQMQEVDQWTLGLIADLDESKWNLIPELGTSIHWQLGHITISKYFHTIDSIVPNEEAFKADIAKEIDIPALFQYYFAGSDPKQEWSQRPSSEGLLDLFHWISALSYDVLQNVDEVYLSEPTTISNPVAKTVQEALFFSFKHQMWHNGQLALLKRMVSE